MIDLDAIKAAHERVIGVPGYNHPATCRHCALIAEVERLSALASTIDYLTSRIAVAENRLAAAEAVCDAAPAAYLGDVAPMEAAYNAWREVAGR